MSTPEGIEMGYILDDRGNRTGEIVTRAEWDRRQEGINELVGFVAALARDDIPTLAEVMAADSWVTLDGGGIVPERLKRASGWGDDADRDSQAAQELARLVKHMDELAEDYAVSVASGSAQVHLMAVMLDDVVGTWQAIRKITRENGGK